jgi:glycine/D-amino acid oxidase-like deaminating enzyme
MPGRQLPRPFPDGAKWRTTADVVIIGGAVMGSSFACQLAMRDDFPGRIVVVEADPSYQICASARSAASIRQQFSSAINIEISLYGIRIPEGDRRAARRRCSDRPRST